MLKQVTQNVGTQAVGALHQFTRLLKRLAHANLAQHLQQGALRRRDPGRAFAFLKRADVEQRIGLLVEQPLAVIIGWEPQGKPLRQAPRRPAVEVQDRLLGHVVAHAIPVERGLAADVQPLESALQQDQAGVQGERVVRPAIDAARQPAEPAGADVVDGEVGRDPQGGQVLGRERRPRRQAGVEGI